MEKADLTALIVKAQAGDQGAMEEILRTAHASVSYQCRKLLRDPCSAEDATQEVLLTVYTRLGNLKNPAAFWGWLNTTTANRCMDVLRRGNVELQFAEDEEGHSVLDNLEELDEQSVPDKSLDNAETTRMIEEIVNSLPEAQRICVLMYYYDEMSVKDIASALGVPENTVKSRLNYARKAIKEQVLDYEKKGVKLYGLSPLPFMLYFLLRAAEETADSTAAGAMAKKAVELGAAAAAGAGGTAGAGAAGGGTAAGGTTAGGAAAAAGGAASKGISAKLIAGALACLLAVGGIAAAVAITQNRDEPEPVVSEAVPEGETAPVKTAPVETAPEETEPSAVTPNGYPLDPRWADLQPGQTAIQLDNVYVQSGMTLREVAEALEGSELSFSLPGAVGLDVNQELQVGPENIGGWLATPIETDVYYGGARAFTVCYFAGLPGNQGEPYLRGDCPVFAVHPIRKSSLNQVVTRVGTVGECKALNRADLDQFAATAFPADVTREALTPWGKDGRHISGYTFTTRCPFSWNGYTIYYDGEPGFPSVTVLEFYEDTGELHPTWELDQPRKTMFHELGLTAWKKTE